MMLIPNKVAVVGASLSEPHINGIYSCARIVYILLLLLLWYVGHAKYICPAWLYAHARKVFFCAF